MAANGARERIGVYVDRNGTERKKQREGGTNIGDVLKKAKKARGYTNDMLAEALGYASHSGIGMMLGGRRIRFDTAVAVLDVLGFDVIVRDRNSANKENVWRIELSDNGEEE